MYEYIKGNITNTGKDFLIIENNGIGYRIFTSNNTLAMYQKNDIKVTIFTYLHVREDIFILYGFAKKEELSLFNMLISISGVGPKAALSLLSAFSPQAVALAIAGNNPDELTRAKGIGKKTAQRIILELKDKFKVLEKEAMLGIKANFMENTVIEEAKTALMVLGYNPRESGKAVDVSFEENITVEKLIRKCLNYMNS